MRLRYIGTSMRLLIERYAANLQNTTLSAMLNSEDICLLSWQTERRQMPIRGKLVASSQQRNLLLRADCEYALSEVQEEAHWGWKGGGGEQRMGAMDVWRIVKSGETLRRKQHSWSVHKLKHALPCWL